MRGRISGGMLSPGVDQDQLGAAFVGARAHAQGPARGHRVHRVLHERDDGLPQRGGARLDRRRRAQVRGHLDRAARPGSARRRARAKLTASWAITGSSATAPR